MFNNISAATVLNVEIELEHLELRPHLRHQQQSDPHHPNNSNKILLSKSASVGSERLSCQTAVLLGNPKSASILLEVFLSEGFSWGKIFRIFLFDLLFSRYLKEVLKNPFWAFPAGPVVKGPCFHFRELVFDPWSGNPRPQTLHSTAKK